MEGPNTLLSFPSKIEDLTSGPLSVSCYYWILRARGQSVDRGSCWRFLWDPSLFSGELFCVFCASNDGYNHTQLEIHVKLHLINNP